MNDFCRNFKGSSLNKEPIYTSAKFLQCNEYGSLPGGTRFGDKFWDRFVRILSGGTFESKVLERWCPR